MREQERITQQKREEERKKEREEKLLAKRARKKQEKERQTQENPTDISFLLESGDRAMELEKYEAGVAAYEAALRLKPESKGAQKGIRKAQTAKKAQSREIIKTQLDLQERSLTQPITAYFHEATLFEILDHLEKVTGTTFVVSEEVKQDQGRSTLFIDQMSLEDALQEVLKDKDFVYTIKDQTISITKPINSR